MSVLFHYFSVHLFLICYYSYTDVIHWSIGRLWFMIRELSIIPCDMLFSPGDFSVYVSSLQQLWRTRDQNSVKLLEPPGAWRCPPPGVYKVHRVGSLVLWLRRLGILRGVSWCVSRSGGGSKVRVLGQAARWTLKSPHRKPGAYDITSN